MHHDGKLRVHAYVRSHLQGGSNHSVRLLRGLLVQPIRDRIEGIAHHGTAVGICVPLCHSGFAHIHNVCYRPQLQQRDQDSNIALPTTRLPCGC